MASEDTVVRIQDTVVRIQDTVVRIQDSGVRIQDLVPADTLFATADQAISFRIDSRSGSIFAIAENALSISIARHKRRRASSNWPSCAA
jgi:hypothetical protein